ncbi:hypothetical protein CLOM_g4798 [Closterium sp. NIES-68]|nr:hypothetical protein CLOM_g4798 [Closterium sp. NIES-68]GJP60272.1 hypothetical protein CLOP_g17483 [Closterium sp. NIES-67]
MDGADLSKCVCEAGAVPWIRDWFQDCVYSRWDLLSFLIGLASIACWLVAQLPQFIQNIRAGSADALSPWFLFQWLSGDLLNLLGCLLSGSQLITQTFTAIYFIAADCCIIAQYVYYQLKNRDSLELDADCLSRPASAQDGFITAAAFSSPSAALRRPLLPAKAAAAADHSVLVSNGSASRAQSVVSPPRRKPRHAVEEIRALENELPYRELEAGGAAAATTEHESHIHRQQQQHRHEHHNYHPVSFLAGRSGAVLLAHAWQGPHLPSAPRRPSLPPPTATQAAGAGAGAEAAEADVVGEAAWRRLNGGGGCREGGATKGGDGRGRLLRIAEEEDGRPGLFPVASDNAGAAAGRTQVAGARSRRRATGDEAGGGEGRRGEGPTGRVQFREEERGAGGEGEGRRGRVYSRREVRRVVERYGLEHGPPMLHPRLTIHHHALAPLPLPVAPRGEEHGQAAGGPGGVDKVQRGGQAAGADSKDDGRGSDIVVGQRGKADMRQRGQIGTGQELAVAEAADGAAAVCAATAGEPSEGGSASAGEAAPSRPHKPGALSLLLGSLMLLALSSSALSPLQRGRSSVLGPRRGGRCSRDPWPTGEAEAVAGRKLLGVQQGEQAGLWHHLRGGGHAGQQQVVVQEERVWHGNRTLCLLQPRHPNCQPTAAAAATAAHVAAASAVSGAGSVEGREPQVLLQLLPPAVPGAGRGSEGEGDEEDAWIAACRAERRRRRKEPSKFIHQLGLMLGWASAGFYLGSRVSQIWQNTQRGSVEGLSMAMFLCAFCGNLAYGTAILLRAPSLASLSGNLPWLVGSMGTLSLDITIYLQAQYLSRKSPAAHASAVRPITIL